MDPQAVLEIILTSTGDELKQAFIDLANWLKNGGFLPKLTNLGETTIKIDEKFIKIPRQWISSQNYVIQTVKPNVHGLYEFVIWDSTGVVDKK
jgi:hypothetical protein